MYPSQRMFFEAMKRKGHAVVTGAVDGKKDGATASTAAGALPEDMAAVVPIHNAVNERAWKLIREWEAPYVRPNSR